MKKTIIFLTLLTLAASARAADPQAWDKSRPEFKYFQEQDLYSQETWDELAPAARDAALEKAESPALGRQEAEAADYAAVNRKWDLQEAAEFTRALTNEKLKAVYLWVGEKEGHELNHKVYVVKTMLAKASADGINDADAQALAPYLTPEAINGMRSMKFAADLAKKQKEGAQAKGPGSQSTAKLDKVAAGAPGSMDASKLSGLYTGSKASGEAYEVPKGAIGALTGKVAAPMGKFVGQNVSQALGAPNAPTASTVKYAAPAALDEAGKTKSSAWTSDAYGVTVETSEGTKTFRKTGDADAAIRKMPAGSVKKVTFYGHGSPGMQMVGEGSYDSDSAAELLKGKMAKGGVIQFAGCNTSSIGGSTLNPAVGLSMVARRLLYFSLPYFQDRADGVPAAQAKEQWDKGWNADLAKDTSLGVKGAIVCGYRTFGLVPGRLPGVTKLLGNQESTTPGYVAGKKACYQDGKEVPVP
jgi:hypothetical protein